MVKYYLKVIKKSFTFRRLLNCIKVLISYGLSLIIRKPIVWGYPPMLMIEPTNICNLQCPLCPSGAGKLIRERGYMSLEMFKNIVDQVQKDTFGLLLWNQGEPFLNPEFNEMLAYANSKRLYLMTSTNANVKFDSQTIIKTGLDLIIVSLDGATQKTYSKYRKGGVLADVIDNAKNLIKAKKDLKMTTPLIVWQFLVMKHNEHEIDQIKTLSKDLGVDILAFKTVQIYIKEEIEEFLPQNKKYCRYKLSKDRSDFMLPTLKNRCYRIWMQPVINWDGQVSVCCFDKDNSIKVGNIKQDKFKKIWKSKKITTFRKNILKNRKKYEICRNCGEGSVLKIN